MIIWVFRLEKKLKQKVHWLLLDFHFVVFLIKFFFVKIFLTVFIKIISQQWRLILIDNVT